MCERLDIPFTADVTHDIDRGGIDACFTILGQSKFWKKGQAFGQGKTNGIDFIFGLLRHLIFIGFSLYFFVRIPVWLAFYRRFPVFVGIML